MRPTIALSALLLQALAASAFVPSTIRPGSITGRPLRSAPAPTVAQKAQVPARARMIIDAIKGTEDEVEPLPENLLEFNKFVINTVKGAIDVIYAGRDFQRFYVLETVARVPYFAYMSVLHLLESFGYRTKADYMRVHYAEADNELHHLLIMESLGGADSFLDRFLAQHMAFGYYWFVILVYLYKPQMAYHLSELIEDHAYLTYDKFIKTKGDFLKTQPVPDIAKKYYLDDNPYLFDTFVTISGTGKRTPELNNLYDVFCNIRDDEREHWETLCCLVQYSQLNHPEGGEIKGSTGTSYAQVWGGNEVPQ